MESYRNAFHKYYEFNARVFAFLSKQHLGFEHNLSAEDLMEEVARYLCKVF